MLPTPLECGIVLSPSSAWPSSIVDSRVNQANRPCCEAGAQSSHIQQCISYSRSITPQDANQFLRWLAHRLTYLDIYNNPRATKGNAYVHLRQSGQGTPNLFNTIDREDHRKKRRIIAPVVSESSMRVFEPQMQLQIDSFLTQLLESSRRKEIVNMTPRCERLGVDVVGELAFGYPLNTQTDPTHRVIIQGLKTRSDRSTLYFFWSKLRFLEQIFNLGSGRHSLIGFYRSIMTMIKARMSLPKDAKHDFYSLASGNLSSGEQGLISKDLWAEAVFFIAAGK